MTSVSTFFNRVLSRLSPQRRTSSGSGSSDQRSVSSGSRSPSPRPPSLTLTADMSDNSTPRMTRSRTRAKARGSQSSSRRSTDGSMRERSDDSTSSSRRSLAASNPTLYVQGPDNANGNANVTNGLNGNGITNGNVNTDQTTKRSSKRSKSVNGNTTHGVARQRASCSELPTKVVDDDDSPEFPNKTVEELPKGVDEEDENDNSPECAVCLLPCIHPVQLPCTHIFCYLCVKGVANQSKRCALCRQEIPVDFLNNPALLRLDCLLKEWQIQEGYQWYYEGKNGWWQYDERTSVEMEEKYAEGENFFEILIAGFLYVIDLKNMIQIRRNDPTRRRRIKRDTANIPDKKGVAGLKVCTNSAPNTPERRQGDGGEVAAPQGVAQGAMAVQPSAPAPDSPDSKSPKSAKAAKADDDSPTAPSNTPQDGESGSPRNNSVSDSDEDLPSQMTSLRLARERRHMQIPRMRRRRRHRHFHHVGHHFMDTPSTSSDSDYDYHNY